MNKPSNLPPGITPNMIPGNRPEDEEWESVHLHIDFIANEFEFNAGTAKEIFIMGLKLYAQQNGIKIDPKLLKT